MNANDLIADLELEPSWTGEERTILLRALRLLAAAEGGEGLTVPAHMRLRPDHVGVYDEVVLASDYYALAARVRELERGIEIATDRLTGPGGVLSAIDAARSK